MYTTKQLKSLPKIEVSFQDDFSGAEREVILTPQYILRKLNEMNLKAKIGDKILLWEKDVNEKDEEYYMCNIGQIIEAKKDVMEKYSNSDTLYKKLTRIDDKPVIVQINRNGYFDLPIQHLIFISR